MSDDTKALVERLRTIGIDALDSSRAADAIERLEREIDEVSSSHRAEYLMRCALERELADRDALAERCEKLREALARIGDLCEFTLVRRDFVYGIGQIEGAVQEAFEQAWADAVASAERVLAPIRAKVRWADD